MSSVEAGGASIVTLSNGTVLPVGEVVAKYSLDGNPDNDTITGRIVIGHIGERGIYEDEDSGLVLAHISSAVVRQVKANYSSGLNFGISASARELKSNTSFEYDHAIALHGLLANPDDVTAAVDRLVDNGQYRQAYEWHASVANWPTHRALQRALRMASGNLEINIPVDDPIPATESEKRADCMAGIGHLGMIAFMVMPPTKPE